MIWVANGFLVYALFTLAWAARKSLVVLRGAIATVVLLGLAVAVVVGNPTWHPTLLVAGACLAVVLVLSWHLGVNKPGPKGYWAAGGRGIQRLGYLALAGYAGVAIGNALKDHDKT